MKDFPAREKPDLTEKVARYLVLAGTLDKNSAPDDYEMANELSLELAMVLPSPIYRAMVEAATHPDGKVNPGVVAVMMREQLLGADAGRCTRSRSRSTPTASRPSRAARRTRMSSASTHGRAGDGAAASRPCTASSRRSRRTRPHAASLQFVRKLSGFNKPSKVNEAAFGHAVDQIATVAAELLASLETRAAPRHRDELPARMSRPGEPA